MPSGKRRIRLLLKFVTRSVSHYQSIIEGLLERDIGIEKYFSFVIIKSPFVKNHYPLESLFSQNHSWEILGRRQVPLRELVGEKVHAYPHFRGCRQPRRVHRPDVGGLRNIRQHLQ